MKRILFFIIMIATMANAICQEVHAKFQGIPIDGNISSFQSKIVAKGWEYDALTTQYINSNVHLYKGKFIGRSAHIGVYYTPTSKNVYKIRVLIDLPDITTVKNTISDLRDMYYKKYGVPVFEDKNKDGKAIYSTGIFNVEKKQMIGTIFISYDESSQGYTLTIDYEDIANNELMEVEMISEL